MEVSLLFNSFGVRRREEFSSSGRIDPSVSIQSLAQLFLVVVLASR